MKKNNPFQSRPGVASLGALLLLSMTVALRVGSSGLSGAEFFGGLFRRPGYENATLILYYVRLPRVLGAALAGTGLALSGTLLQSVTGNDLAGPNIIGVNAGAGFAVIFTLFLAPGAAALTPFFAFAGAFATTLLIISIASRVQSAKATVILAGIAVTALLNAGISLISLLDTDVLASYNDFSIGGLAGVTLGKLPVPAVIVAVSLAVSLALSRRIDTLCLGDAVAVSLGVNVKALRLVCLICASAAAAAAVSFAGLLGFVGLVAPHIARRLCGGSRVCLLPVAALTGAILVTLADLLGRVLFAPSEAPVGIVMAGIGAPFFFWLLLRKQR